MSELLKNYALGARIDFIEQEGEFLHKQIGDTICGTLVLEQEENEQFIISFQNPQVMLAANLGGVFRGLLKALSRDNSSPDNISFSYTAKEKRDQTKQFSFWTAELLSHKKFMIECYNLNTHKGCWYSLENEDTAIKWAKAIGIQEIKYCDINGNVEQIKTI